MEKMAKEIVSIIVDEYGTSDFLARISDPFWFQALGCALGYDWHSSGVTTVLTGVLKRAVSTENHRIGVCGGKGRTSKKSPEEIRLIGERFGFSTQNIDNLCHASRMSAKVDNAAVQADYPLYHHAFFVAENREWAVVQQGMSTEDRTARRYHWISKSVNSFVVEPHNAIVGNTKRQVVLDMTAKGSEGCRKASVDLSKEKPERLIRMFESIRPKAQTSLSDWLPENQRNSQAKYPFDFLKMPRNINWKTLQNVYEFQPQDYEGLLGFKGVGPATIRGLALVAEIIYGESPSKRDPVKYSFAYGGKDGVPYPVDRKAMDESINVLRGAVEKAKMGEKERLKSLRSLMRFVPKETVASEKVTSSPGRRQ
jgi:hypothetical protein